MAENYLDKPVFICGHRKSGTTMLINLFDNASDAVVYPDDSGYFYLYYPQYEADSFTDTEKINRLAERIVETNLGDVIERNKCTEEEKNQLYQNSKNYQELIKSCDLSGFTTKEILPFFINAYKEAFVPNNDPKVWIEKTTSTELYAGDLIKFFPNAKFIHMVRDPRDNWSSLKSGWDQRYKDFNDEINRLKHSMIERGKLGLEYAKYNEEIIGKEQYKVIKFEDFVVTPEDYMKELAEFIGIEFNKNLLIPTTFGYSWEGNNFDGIKNTKPSTVNVARWKERINTEDAQLMEYYFYDIMLRFGYEPVFPAEERQRAATEHYKWYNFSTPYSAK